MTHQGPWLQTLGGGALDLCDPKPEQINLRHAAKVLARIPRFGGHTRDGVLSVAQHEVEGARAIMRETGREDAAAAFLLHDHHEYAIGDIATPVAEALAYMVRLNEPEWIGDVVLRNLGHLKARLDRVIYQAAGIQFPLQPDVAAIVREYDLRMCITERNERLDPCEREWSLQAVPLFGCDLTPWPAELAESLLIAACEEFGVRVGMQ